MRPSPFVVVALFGAVGLTTSPAVPGAHAQAGAAGDTLVFERVGDRPISAFDLDFDGIGTLWAINVDVWRLDPEATAWEKVGFVTADYILPLGPDTLLAGRGAVRRSVDGGRTWERVSEFGDDFFATSSGTLLTGTAEGTGAGYSTDRGATWQMATFTGEDPGDAEAFVELPQEHADAGRLVAACFNGVMYSDDDGRTWQESSLWEDFFYFVTSVAVGADDHLYATEIANLQPNLRLRESTDRGQTWEVAHTFTAPGGSRSYVVTLAGEGTPTGVVVVEFDGDVWRSDDAAQTWRLVGRVPWGDFTSPRDVVVGPDDRLYVAAVRSGTENEWVYRTVGPVVSAHEPGAVPAETGVRLGVRPNPFRGSATVTLTLAVPSHVRLSVHDGLGREVTLLADRLLGAGEHTFRWEAAGLPSGAYLLRLEARLEAGSTVLSRRVTLLR